MRERTATPTVDLAALYRDHRGSLIRMARLLVDTPEAAEDAVHDAFLGTARNLGSLRDPEAALGYIRRAVVNRSRSQLRRRRTARAHLRVAEPQVAPPADDAVLLAEEHREVLAALDTLPPRQREVLVLRYWSDLSEAQIADALGISRGTVKSQASRAIAALGERMAAR